MNCLLGGNEDAHEADQGYVCNRHFSRLRSSLLELPAIATWLEVHLAAGGVAGERVGGSRDDPIPLRVDVLDHIGPDSRHWVTDARPSFLLWADGEPVAEFTRWQDASTAMRTAMQRADIHPDVVELLTNRPDHDRPEIGFDCTEHCPLCRLLTTDRDLLDAAQRRWQIRPTGRGGDQRGEDAIRSVLFAWVRMVAEPDPDMGKPEFAWPERCDLIYPLAAWLSGHLSWIVAQPWVDEFAEEIHKAAAGAHRVVPWRDEVMYDKEPCSTCGVRAVVLHVADSTLKCEKHLGGCGKTTVSDYLRRATA